MGQGGGIATRPGLSPGFIATGCADPSEHPARLDPCGCHTTTWRPHEHLANYSARDWVLCPMHDRQARDRVVRLADALFKEISKKGWTHIHD